MIDNTTEEGRTMRLLDEPFNRGELLAHLESEHGHIFHRVRDRFHTDDDTDVLEMAHREDHGGPVERDHAHAN